MLQYLISVKPGKERSGIKVYMLSLVRLRCKQLFLELQNWERSDEPQKWIQNGLFLAENGYAVSHPLSKRPVD